MNDAELKSLRAMCDKATPGPRHAPNAEFIAAARTAIPRLLDHVEGQREFVKAVCKSANEIEAERDEARANAELFRASAYKLEELVATRNKERDEARAEVERLRHALYDVSLRIAKQHETECDCRWCEGTDLPDDWVPTLPAKEGSRECKSS